MVRNSAARLDFRVFDAATVSAQAASGAGVRLAAHRALWQRTVESGRPALLFEDWAAVRRDLREALPEALAILGGGWDVIVLGHETADDATELSFSEGLDLRLRFLPARPDPAALAAYLATSGPVGLVRVAKLGGAFAYMIAPRGAARLLRLLPLPDGPQNAQSLEADFSRAWRELKAYSCLPPLAFSVPG